MLAEISGYPPCQGRICTGRGSIVALRLGLRDRLSGPLAGPDALAPSSQPRNSVISTIAAPVLPAVPLQPNILIGNATGHTITFSRLSRSTKHNKINRTKYDHVSGNHASVRCFGCRWSSVVSCFVAAVSRRLGLPCVCYMVCVCVYVCVCVSKEHSTNFNRGQISGTSEL